MTEDTPALATSTAPNGRAMRVPILVAECPAWRPCSYWRWL